MQHYPPIPASVASQLDEYFAPFDDALAQLLNRDLPWRCSSSRLLPERLDMPEVDRIPDEP